MAPGGHYIPGGSPSVGAEGMDAQHQHQHQHHQQQQYGGPPQQQQQMLVQGQRPMGPIMQQQQGPRMMVIRHDGPHQQQMQYGSQGWFHFRRKFYM